MQSPTSLRRGNAQLPFFPIEGVANASLCLQIGTKHEWVAVLEVQGISSRFRSEEEQYQLNEQFQQILRSLSHPLQILLRVVPMDAEHYLSLFADTATSTITLLVRRFYVVIPVLSESVEEQDEPTLATLRAKMRASKQEAARAGHQLAIRCQQLSQQLQSMSLSTRRLSNDELMALVYAYLRSQEAPPSWIEEGVNRQESQEKHPQSGSTAPLWWSTVADFTVPTGIQVFSDHIQIENECIQILDIHTLQKPVMPSWFHQLLCIDEVMDVSLFYLPQTRSTTLRHKRFEALLEQGRYPDPEQGVAQMDTESLIDWIADREVLSFAMHVLVRGTSQHELQARSARIRAMLYSMQLESRVAYFEQEKGLHSCLPYARSELRTNTFPLILGLYEASSTFPFLP